MLHRTNNTVAHNRFHNSTSLAVDSRSYSRRDSGRADGSSVHSRSDFHTRCGDPRASRGGRDAIYARRQLRHCWPTSLLLQLAPRL